MIALSVAWAAGTAVVWVGAFFTVGPVVTGYSPRDNVTQRDVAVWGFWWGTASIFLLVLLGRSLWLGSAELPRLPSLLFTRQDRKRLVLVLEPSQLFSLDAVVSIYIIDDAGFELHVATGAVVNIQGDEKVQVELTSVRPGHEDTVEKMARNDPGLRPRVLVKPTISRMNILEIYDE